MEYELRENTYRVKDYEMLLANCKEWVNEKITLLPEHIESKDQLKAVKEIRAENNKQIKAIKDFRIQLNEQVLGTINAEIKDFEKKLGELETACKTLVDEEKKKEAKPQPLELRIYSFNKDVLEKIKAYAEKQGATCDIL